MREGDDQIWLVSIPEYDPGHFDKEWNRVEAGPSPFMPDEVLTMCPVITLKRMVARGGPILTLRAATALDLEVTVKDALIARARAKGEIVFDELQELTIKRSNRTPVVQPSKVLP